MKRSPPQSSERAAVRPLQPPLKGGTVVPPSDFQVKNLETRTHTALYAEFLHAHGHAPAPPSAQSTSTTNYQKNERNRHQ